MVSGSIVDSSAASDRLAEISGQLRNGQPVPPVATRDFLSWFGAQRRGYWVVKSIRRELRKVGLETHPDFESAYLDARITFELVKATEKRPRKDKETDTAEFIGTVDDTTDSSTLRTASVFADPTFRISKLSAANRAPTHIAPTAPIQEAVTVMLANDYSQLPVMTSDREVKGIISWASIGTRLAVGRGGNYVRELMDAHQEIRADSSLFRAIPIIVEYEYVLIRGNNNIITGIVTASDLALQFQQLAEPFLLLGEIENHIRRILGDNFSTEELNATRVPEDRQRRITSVADLSFGEYIRLLENEERWKKIFSWPRADAFDPHRTSTASRGPPLGGPPDSGSAGEGGVNSGSDPPLPPSSLSVVDRAVFCTQLNKVREIRNDVMHFDPDGILPADLGLLRDFAHFLRRLQIMGVP